MLKRDVFLLPLCSDEFLIAPCTSPRCVVPRNYVARHRPFHNLFLAREARDHHLAGAGGVANTTSPVD